MRSTFSSMIAVAVMIAAAGTGGGCATKIRKPVGEPQPAKVKLGEFKHVELTAVVIAPALGKANAKAVAKLDGLIDQKVRHVFTSVSRPGEAAAAPGGRTLRITPEIEDMKFIGGAARFWVGAMAGSSAVLMKVKLQDAASGEVLAEPEFYRAANAFTGGQTIGVTDNLMLDQIADDIANYCARNR